MDFALFSTETAEGWEEWHGTNVDSSDGMVRLAKERPPAYVSPRELIEDPPPSFTPVDVDVDECGDLYVLTADREIYRYDHEKPALRRLPCLWYPADEAGEANNDRPGDPDAICVTEDSIYVVDGALDGVVAFSKHQYQLRWVASEPFEEPVTMVGGTRTGYVLDRGLAEGEGFVVAVASTGPAEETVIAGLEFPGDRSMDLAMGPDGGLHVLDWLKRNGGDEEDSRAPVVRRFAAASRGDPEFSELVEERVRIPPDYDPRCLDVVTGREVLVGAGGLQTDRRTFLYRHIPDEERFERIDGVTEPCARLLLRRRETAGLGRGLYVVSAAENETRQGDRSGLSFLDQVRRYRRNPTTEGYDAQIWRRFDAGEQGTQWHRVTAGLRAGDTGTQVRLRYHAANDEEVGELEEFGVDPAHADRLRQAHVTGAWGLLELGQEGLTDLLGVSRDRAAEWIDRAWAVARVGLDRNVEAIPGIASTFGDRLRDADVVDVADILERTPEEIATIAEAPTAVAESWFEGAQGIVDETVEDWEEAIDLDPVAAAQLRGAGVTRLSGLISHSPATLADRLRIPPDRTAWWIQQARSRIDAEWADRTAPTITNPRDVLLDDATGRYLWIRIDLLGSESSSPGIDAFRAYFPRQSYLRYLPGIYREDAESAVFLERFLSIFERTFVGVEEDIESATRYLDALGVPTEYLAWLGQWLAVDVDEAWPESFQRTFVDEAPELFKKRGTREGLLELLVTYLGDEATLPADWEAALERDRKRIRGLVDSSELTPTEAADVFERMTRSVYLLEYSDLDCIDEAAAKRPYVAQLGCPQCFLVLLPPFATDEQLRAVDRIVDSMTPAHAIGRAVRLPPWIQLAGESHRGTTYLGINSVLAERDFVLEESTLGTDSVLEEREEFSTLELRSRLGTDTVMS